MSAAPDAGERKPVLEIVSREQIAELRANGWVVIHREPTESMVKAFYANQWPECVEFKRGFHRVVGCSIREQNK